MTNPPRPARTKKPTWVIDKERARRASAAETVWLFGLHAVRDALLNPNRTRLRLVLWGLDHGLSEFPESPPPGLVTIPNIVEVPKQHYTLAGYRPAGKRAIRIDMLERLADLLRAKDWRAGFEATPEMLSITGMTLEQFSGLMQGLGYSADRGERAKVKATETPAVIGPEVADPAMRYSGNNLACTSCHQENATKPYAMPWTGVTGRFRRSDRHRPPLSSEK